jgi:hypothetical protein
VYGENGRQAAECYFDRRVIVDRFLDHLEEHL